MHRMTIQYDAPDDPAAFEEYYTRVHVPLVAQVPGVQRFTLSHPRMLADAEPIHLVAELWFADREAFREAMATPEMAATGQDAEGMRTTYGVTTTMFTGDVADAL